MSSGLDSYCEQRAEENFHEKVILPQVWSRNGHAEPVAFGLGKKEARQEETKVKQENQQYQHSSIFFFSQAAIAKTQPGAQGVENGARNAQGPQCAARKTEQLGALASTRRLELASTTTAKRTEATHQQGVCSSASTHVLDLGTRQFCTICDVDLCHAFAEFS